MKHVIVRKWALMMALLVTALMIGALSAQGQEPVISGNEALRWDLPGFERTAVEITSEEPITVTFIGNVQVRNSDGEVLAEQPLKTDCWPGETCGSGQCGNVISWSWDPAEFPRIHLEIWKRQCWQTSVYSRPSCAVHVPVTCDLTGAGCTIDLDAGGQTVIPDNCMTRLEECGTRRDENDFWLVKSFTGTKLWGRCLPLVAVGGESSH